MLQQEAHNRRSDAPERNVLPAPAKRRRPTTPPNLINTGVVVPNHTVRSAKVKREEGVVSDTDGDDASASQEPPTSGQRGRAK